MDNSIPEGIVRLTRQRDEAVAALAAERALADGAVALLNEHRCGDAAERAYKRAARAEARADQAEQRIADAPHAANCSLVYSVWKSSATRCTCWKSAAPTAEQ